MSDGPTKKVATPVEAPHIEQYQGAPEKKERPSLSTQERIPVEPRPAETVPVSVARPAAPAAAPQKSPLRQEIENVLEEDLLPLYRELTPKQRKQFKDTGEKTAAAIELALKRVKVTIIEIIRLIRKWLLLLPHANVFFIEQEAKIKAERIYQIKNEQEESKKK